jgi:hypothetical protein
VVLTVIVVAFDPAAVVMALPPTVEPAGRLITVPLPLIVALPIHRALSPSVRYNLPNVLV